MYQLINAFIFFLNTCTSFYSHSASQQALKHGLSLEVDRLRELIEKLENKVHFF